MSLSLCMIVQNEQDIVLNPIKQLYPIVDKILILDGGSEDETVNVIRNYPDKDNKIVLFQNKFIGHFGDQKNLITSRARTKWVINIDADEVLSDTLLYEIPHLIKHKNVDAYFIPRKNLIDNVDTGVFPDYQLRLYRSYCRWIFPVHEELVGWSDKFVLDDDACIIHSKTSERQNKQNMRYKELSNKFINLMR